MESVAKTYGALILSALLATGLSGVVIVQTILYFKLYPLDHPIIKSLVAIVWTLDMTHSGLICSSMWDYLVNHFGDLEFVDDIPKTISLSIVFTGILTLGVHCFFAHRIYRLSQGSLFLTCPIIVLAVLRLASAAGTTSQMMRLHSYTLFKEKFRWIFSLGLALSTAVDIFVTFSLFFLLKNTRTKSANLHQVIDSLILYTLEIGSLTCAATIVSMICWLTMSNNLIFLGLHFVIGKLYANSLLATLNTRHSLRRQKPSSQVLMEINSGMRHRALPFLNTTVKSSTDDLRLQHLQINVEKSVEYDAEVQRSSSGDV